MKTMASAVLFERQPFDRIVRWRTVAPLGIAAALTIAYPFFKRFVSIPQFILGAAFGWAAPMAFAAHTGGTPQLAWLVFGAALVWAVIYDTFYAMVDREDDLKIGVKSTAILFGERDRLIIGLLQVAMLLMLVAVFVLSAFINDTPIVVLMIPILVGIALRTKLPASGFMLPMGLATIMGGMSTTIGTSTNLLVVGITRDLGVADIAMFDVTLPALLVGGVGVIGTTVITPNNIAPSGVASQSSVGAGGVDSVAIATLPSPWNV